MSSQAVNRLIIMSSGRSGSTWFAKLFDTHPDVLYRHEPDSVLHHHSLPFHPAQDEQDTYVDSAREYLKTLEDVRTVKTTMRRPFFEKSFRSPVAEKLHHAAGYLAALGERLKAPPALTPIPDLMSSDNAPKLLVMKSVSSLGRMALFAEADPNARFIHLIRHPAAVAASKLRGVEAGVLKANSYHEAALTLPEARHYPFTKEEAAGWSFPEQCTLAWLVFNDTTAASMVNNDHYRAVHYENFCTNVDIALPALFSFSGLSWNNKTQTFLASLNDTVASNNKHFSIMRPPTASLYKWKTALSPDQIAGIKYITSYARTRPVREAAQFQD